MDIAAYLEQQRTRMEDRGQQVKDYAVFDFNYVPDRPLMRNECRRVIDAMLRFDITGIPSNMVIVGSRGSGKTLTMRYLQRTVANQTGLDVLYANCRANNTSFKILAHLIGAQARGASLTELYERFCRQCKKPTVVILDEVDLMSQKDRRREILYLLSRAEQPFMVVMLSNNPGVMKELDAPTRSSLQAELIHFKNYDAQQLHEILDTRANKGLHKWEPSHLSQIAALTARKTNSDTRIAIKTLYYAVTEPADDVESNFERAQREIVVDMIANVSDTNLMILTAASKCRQQHAKSVYRLYCQLTQNRGETSFSYVYFYASLSYLQSIGLVALVSTKVGRTYTNRVLLTFDPDMLQAIVDARLAQ